MNTTSRGLLIAIPMIFTSSCALDQEDESPQTTRAVDTLSSAASTTCQVPAGRCHAAPGSANCDNCDPTAQGCSGDAVSVAGFTRSFPWGTIELRWSASCQTNWTRFTAGYSGFWDVSVERQSPHLRVGDVVSINGGGQHFTNMVFAPGPAQSCTNDVSSDNGACTGYTN
jgi:hypothetical protein